MTREEAIRTLEDTLEYRDRYCNEHDIERNALTDALDMAISALREQCVRDATKTSGWISVEERLPECDQRVLCRYTFGGSGRMYFHQVLDYYATDPQPHFQHTLGDNNMRVTHWMPLPEAPKEEA